MLIERPSDEALIAAMRAGYAIAMADGVLRDAERRMLLAAARALSLDVDVDALEAIDPAGLAELITDPAVRERVVQALIVMSLIDGEPERHEIERIEDFASALEVEERRVHNLRQAYAGHSLLVRLDLNRRSEMVKVAADRAYEVEGLEGLRQMYGSFLGLAHDPERAQRFRRLGLMPEGSFGREYWAHMTERGFGFPGEHKAFPEFLMKHDLCHVLGGYDTDPVGECEVVAFISGFMRSDPFGYLMMILLHMQLDIEIFYDTPTARSAADPERLVAAYARGCRVEQDLYDPEMDWWSLFPLPLQEVRERLGVPPADEA